MVMRLKFVSLFGKYYGGPKVFGFLKIHEGIADDDHFVANLYFSGCCPVEANTTGTSFSGNDVSFKAFTIVVVNNLHLFAGYHVGGIHKILVDRNGAHVMEVSLRNYGAMNLGF